MTRPNLHPILACTAIAASLLVALPAIAQKAEVIHWWTSGGESAAIKEVAEAYNKAGGTWVDSAVAGGEPARAAAISRIVGGKPPVAAQFNTSKQYHDLIADDLLASMDEVAAKEGWDKLLPAPIINAIKVKGHYYAVPINIHMPAWIFYSKAVLAKAGVAAEPKSVDEFFAALDKIKAAGMPGLAFSSAPVWEALTFNAMLMNVGGSELYLKFYRDRDSAAIASDGFKKVLSSYLRLKGYIDAGATGRSWNDSTSMLITNRAGFQVMGDWAKGEFKAANQVAGKEYGCIAGFGAKSPYMVGGDVFIFPKTADAEAIKAQHLLATVITSKPLQVAFNLKKGSIPIRTDVDASGMDICAQAGLAVMKDPSRQLPSPGMLINPDAAGAVQDVISKFWNNPSPNIDDVVKSLQVAIKR